MKSIKYKSLPEKTANVLSEYLYRENYQVGAKLPNELILAEQFEVSRNTIRKAIQMLADKHILEVRRGSGTFIAERARAVEDPLGLLMYADEKQLTGDLLDVRLMIEPKIAALAAENITAKQIHELEDICDRLEKAVSSGENYYEIDIEFHTFLAGCSRNLVIHNLYPAITQGIMLQERLYVTRNSESTAAAHRRILEAIKAHRPTEAEYAMQLHLIRSRERL